MEFLFGNYYSTLEYLDLTNTKIFFSVELVIWIFKCPKLTRLAFNHPAFLVNIPTGEDLYDLVPRFGEKDGPEMDLTPFKHLILNQKTAFETTFTVEHLVWPFGFGKKFLSKILNCSPRLKTVRFCAMVNILSAHNSWRHREGKSFI